MHEEFLKRMAEISEEIKNEILNHFENGAINLTSLKEFVADKYPELGMNSDKLVENICFFFQEKSQETGFCIQELIKHIKFVGD